MTTRYVVELLGEAEKMRTGKRFQVTFLEDDRIRRVRFGQPGAETYIDGAPIEKKRMYLVRHGSPLSGQDWKKTGKRTAGYWARWALWGASRDIRKNVKKAGGVFVASRGSP